VDDVLEFANLAGFPASGDTGKIYVAIDTGKVYRWSGSTHIEISSAGVADTAVKLSTARTIGMTGDVTWTSASFDGSANVTGTATLANNGVTAGTYKSVTVDAKGRVTAGTNPTTLAGYGITDAAPLASPALTGTPTAPTAAANTNTTQLATTAFVIAQIAAAGSAGTAIDGGSF
jgi:phage-related tail fiber protein